MNLEIILALLAAAVQMGTPILLATLGEIVTERGGILNLGVEGIMSVGALAAFAITLWTGSPVAGLLAAGICGALLAGVHGLVCLGFQGNQVVSGLALTILGVGLANYFGTPLVGKSAPGFQPLAIPGLAQIPLLGPVFFRQDALVYLSILIVPLLWFYLYATRWGLGLRAVGENPEATLSAGLHTIGYRWVGVLVGGWLMGWGGAYLSLAYTHSWTNGLTAGRGWIAVALVIFAFWRPVRALLGAFLFGGVMAFQFRLQAVGTHIPSSLLMMLPYALTIIVLVISSRRGGDDAAPAALGINIEPAE
jgi:general nucleoside transport system permease protein